MVDAEDSKSSARKGVRVRIPPPAPLNKGLTTTTPESLSGYFNSSHTLVTLIGRQ